MYYIVLAFLLLVQTVSGFQSLGAGARHSYNNLHIISDLAGIEEIYLNTELSTGVYKKVLKMDVLQGFPNTQSVPDGLAGCVDPIDSSVKNAGDTINIPQIATTVAVDWAWGNLEGLRKTYDRVLDDWTEDKWLSIAYCDNTVTIYQLEIKLKETIPEDGTSSTQYYWNLEAEFLDGSFNPLSVEQLSSGCPHGTYRNIAQGQYGLCIKCACDDSHTILCDGTSEITPAQYEIGKSDGTYCQPCHCAPGFAGVSAKCANALPEEWPDVCETDSTHEDCGEDFCLPCACDGPGYVYDHVDCDGTLLYDKWLEDKHRGGVDGQGNCAICACSERGYYIDPAICEGLTNKADLVKDTVTYDNNGDFQAWIDSQCKPCSCGNLDKDASDPATYDGYYISTKIGDCDGTWTSHVHGKLKTGTNELLQSINNPNIGVESSYTWTDLTVIDDNAYSQGARATVTSDAYGDIIGLTISCDDDCHSYIVNDILTIHKTKFGVGCLLNSGGREVSSEACSAAPGTWDIPAMQCSTAGTCMGVEGNDLYCYGNTANCLQSDCTEDSDCTGKYTSASDKFTPTGMEICNIDSEGVITVLDHAGEPGNQLLLDACRGRCSDTAYTTYLACLTQSYWEVGSPSTDITITVRDINIQDGIAVAPHSNVKPDAAPGPTEPTAEPGKIWIATQDSTTVATYSANDGWCKKCSCYDGSRNPDTDLLEDVRGNPAESIAPIDPIPGSYFDLNLCPSGKPQAAGGNGIRLDASAEHPMNTDGSGWYDYWASPNGSDGATGGPSHQACVFPASTSADDDNEWDCTSVGLKIKTYTEEGIGYYINSVACDGSTGYLTTTAAASSCCTQCTCASGQFINGQDGKCDGDTVSETQPDACEDCSCNEGQYVDLFYCDGFHPTSAIGGSSHASRQASVGNTPPNYQSFSGLKSNSVTLVDMTVPNDNDGRVCRDCSCSPGQYVDTSAGKCDGLLKIDSNPEGTVSGRAAVESTRRAATCSTCDCNRGGTLSTAVGNFMLASITNGDVVFQDALSGIEYGPLSFLVVEDSSVVLSLSFGTDGVMNDATMISASSSTFSVGDKLTIVMPDGKFEPINAPITFTLGTVNLVNDKHDTIIDGLSYVYTADGYCDGFKKENAPDSYGCLSCTCTSKTPVGEGWFVDATKCNGDYQYDDSVTPSDEYCVECRSKCSLLSTPTYVNSLVCNGKPPSSTESGSASYDGNIPPNGCKSCQCDAGDYIERRDSRYKFTINGLLNNQNFIDAKASDSAVDTSCDGNYVFNADFNDGKGPAGACVDCRPLCTVDVQGTALYVDSSAGKCDGLTGGNTFNTATSPETVLSKNLPEDSCASCVCDSGYFINMEHCNHNIISDTQPVDSSRCSPCKCPDGYWLNYLNEETNRGDLKLNRGTGYGPYGNSDSCLGTEMGTLETGYAFSYNIDNGWTNYIPYLGGAVEKASINGNEVSNTHQGPAAPFYCTKNTVVDECDELERLDATNAFDGITDSVCVPLLVGEMCAAGEPADCHKKCGGTAITCPYMYGYVTRYSQGPNGACEHKCVKWRGDLKDEFREGQITDVSNSAICDLLRGRDDDDEFDLISSCCDNEVWEIVSECTSEVGAHDIFG